MVKENLQMCHRLKYINALHHTNRTISLLTSTHQDYRCIVAEHLKLQEARLSLRDCVSVAHYIGCHWNWHHLIERIQPPI